MSTAPFQGTSTSFIDRWRKAIAALAAVTLVAVMTAMVPTQALAAPPASVPVPGSGETIPNYQEQFQAGPPSSGANSRLGYASQQNGSLEIYTAAVGAPNTPGDGEVVIKQWTGPTLGAWTTKAEIKAPAGSQGFGYSVAIDDAAGVAAVGARFTNNVYVYTRAADGTWSLSSTIAAPANARVSYVGSFGETLALQGKTLVIGAPNSTVDGLQNAGAAYVATIGGSVSPLLLPVGDAGVQKEAIYGQSISLSSNKVAVGAPQYSMKWSDGVSYQVGSVTLWDVSGTASKTAFLTPPADQANVSYPRTDEPASYASFGRSTAFDARGSLYVGAPSELNWTGAASTSIKDTTTTTMGAVYQYASNGSLASKTTAPAHQYYFGDSVAVDGDAVFVSALSDVDGQAGAVFIYDSSAAGSLALIRQLTPDATLASGALFGSYGLSGGSISASTSTDDKGRTRARVAVTSNGVVYIFEPPFPIELSKTAAVDSGATNAKPGPTDNLVTYTIHVKNTTGKALTGASIVDDLTDVLDDADINSGPTATIGSATVTAGILTWKGDLAADQELTITYQVKVKSQVVADSTVEGQAGLVAALENSVLAKDSSDKVIPSVTDDTDVTPTTDPVTTTTLIDGALKLTKTVDPLPDGRTMAQPGDVLHYTLTASNVGGLPLNPASLKDDLSAALTDADFKSATLVTTAVDNKGANLTVKPAVFDNTAPAKITWSDDLAAGSTVTVKYDLQVKSIDTLTNGGGGSVVNSLSSDQNVDPKDPGTTTPIVEPLELSKSVSGADAEGKVLPGATLTYTLVATNPNDSAMSGISLQDNMADVLDDADFVVGSITVTPSSAAAPVFDQAGAKLTWGPATVPANSTVTITYQVMVKNTPTAAAGMQRMLVVNSLTSPQSTDNPGTETPVIGRISLDKSVAGVPAGGQAGPGDVLSYTLTATNTDAETRTGVTLNDNLADVLDNATFDASSLRISAVDLDNKPVTVTGVSFDSAGKLVTWTGDIPGGVTVTITYDITVSAAADTSNASLDPLALKNTLTSPQSTDTPSTNTPLEGKLALAKSSDVPSGKKAVAGQVITYTITASNVGGSDLTAQSIEDNLSDVLSKSALVKDSLSTSGSSSAAVIGADNVLRWTGDVAKGDVVTITYKVTVNGNLADGTTLTNVVVEQGETPNCVPENPACSIVDTGKLELTKTSSPASGATVKPGDVVTYTLSATNKGDSTVKNATLEDDLSGVVDDASAPQNITAKWNDGSTTTETATYSGGKLTWIGDIPAGKTVTVSYTVTVNDPDTGDQLLRNIVTSPQSPDAPSTENPVGDLVLSKSSDVPAGKKAVAGQVITYTITATNSSTGPLTGQSFKDNLTDLFTKADLVAGSLTTTGSANDAVIGSDNVLAWSGDLAAGAVVTVTYKVTVHNALADGTQLINQVVANDKTPENCVTPTNTCSVVDTGKLEMTKTSNPATGSFVAPGATVSYSVSAKNTGDTAVSSATVSDDLTGVLDDAAAPTNIVAKWNDGTATTELATLSGNTISWTGDIPAGKTVTITYSVTVNDPTTGDLVLRNLASSPQSPDKPTTVTGVSGVEVAKSSDVPAGKKAVAGQIITYTLTATNTADGPLVGQSLADDLTDLLTKADLVAGSLTTNGSANSASIDANSVVRWSGDMAKGDVVTITYKVKVKDALPDGTLLVNAVVANDGTTPDCTADPTPAGCVVVPTGALSLKKTANPASGTAVAPGDSVSYSLTATNTGDSTVKAAVLRDDLTQVNLYGAIKGDITVTSSISSKTPAAATAVGDLLSWTGDIEAGETITVSYVAQLDATGIPAGAVLKNSFTSPQSVDNPKTENPIGAMVLAKSSDIPSGKKAVAGQVITYTLTATNSAAGPLAGQSLADDLSDVLSKADLVAGSLTTTGSANLATIDGSNVLRWTGDLAKGDVVTITYQVTVHDALADGTTLVNAVVGNDDETPDCSTGNLPNCSEIPTGALKLNKVADPASGTAVKPGDVVNYTLTATNSGDFAVKNAVLNDDISKVNLYGAITGTPVATSSDAGRTVPAVVLSGDLLTWTGDVAAGETITIGYSVQLNATGLPSGAVLQNHFTSPQSPEDPSTSNPIGDLVVTKASDVPAGQKAVAGQVITYTLTATNTAAGPLAGQSLADDLSDMLTKADMVAGSLTTTGSANAAAIDSSNVLRWAGDLAAGDVVTITYQMTVHNALADGTVLTNAVVANDGETPDCSGAPRPDCSVVPTGALTLTKVADPASGTAVQPGDVVSYTLKATNTGDSTVKAATLKDDLTSVNANGSITSGPVVTSSVAGKTPAAATTSASELAWTGDIEAHEVITITYSVTLDSTGISAGAVLMNHFTSPQSPEDPETVNPIGDIAVTKSTDVPAGDKVVSGQVVTYTVTATNTADGPLKNQSVKDDLSDVLAKADLVTGSLATTGSANLATIDGSNLLTWSGDMAKGDVVTITYQVKIHDALADGTTLSNVAVANNGETPDCTTTPDLPNCSQLEVGALDLAKTADPATGTTVKPGDVVSYSLTATNTGDAPVAGAVLKDNLTQVNALGTITTAPVATSSVAGKTLGAVTVSGDELSWTGDIAAHEVVTITYTVTLKDAADIPAGSVLRNHFTSPQSPEGPETENPIGDLDVTKSTDVPAGKAAAPGQVITYTIVATNTAEGSLVNQSVTDDLSDLLTKADLVEGSLTTAGSTVGATIDSNNVLSWTGDLAKGDVVTITYKVTVHDALADGTQLTNVAVVNGVDDCTTYPERCPVVPVGKLALSKTSDPATGTVVSAGDTVSYTLVAENTADAAISGAVLNDDLSKVNEYGSISGTPVVTSSVSGNSPAAATVSGDQLTWTGDIAAHEKITITYTVQLKAAADIPAGAVLTNHFTSPQSPDGPETENPIGDMTVTKSSDVPAGSKAVAGQVITYTLTATNNAPGELKGQSLKDDLSDLLTKADLVAGSITTTGSANAAAIDAGNVLRWSGDMAEGDVVTITYQVTVHNALADGTKLTNAVVANDGPTPDCSDTDPRPDCSVIPTGALTLAKTADPASGTAVSPGDVVNYSLTATNTGDSTVTGAVLNDNLAQVLPFGSITTAPVATSSVAGKTLAAVDVTGNQLAWTGDIEAHESVTITYSVTLKPTAEIPSGSVLGNHFTSPQSPDEPETSNPIGAMTLTKTADVPSGKKAVAGQVVTYTIVATNSADGDLPGQSLRDDLSDVLSKADLVENSLTTNGSSNNAAIGSDNVLTWSGDLAKGDVVTITYKVKIHNALADGTTLNNVVVANGGTTPDCTTNPELTECSTVETGALDLTKVSDPASGTAVKPGSVVNYTLAATNTGDTVIKSAVLKDDLSDVNALGSIKDAPVATSSVSGNTPAAVAVNGDELSWTGDIAAGETVTITYSVQLKSANDIPAGSVLKNHFTSPQSPEGPETENPVGDLALTKTTDVPSGKKAVAGQVVTYTVTATNNADGPLPGQSIKDDLSDVLSKADLVENSLTTNGSANLAVIGADKVLTWSGDMAKGDVVTITYQVKIHDALPNGTTLKNVAVANGGTTPDCDSDPTLAGCNELVTGSLALAKTSDPASGTAVKPGDVVGYTLTATNTGDSPVSAAVLKDDLTQVNQFGSITTAPVATSSVAGNTPAAVSVNGNELSWTGDIAAGETVTITYSVTLKPAAEIAAGSVLGNHFTSPQSPDEPETNNPIGDLAISKTTDVPAGKTVVAGQVVTYTVTATNNADGPLPGQSIKDDLSDVLSKADLVENSLTTKGSSNNAVIGSDKVLTWSGDMAKGDVVTITYQVKIHNALADGTTIKNVAVANGGTTPDCDSDPTLAGCNELLTGELALAKTADPASGTAVKPGDVVKYTLTATNTGDSTVKAAVLNDDLTDVNALGSIKNAPVATSSVAGKDLDAVNISGDQLSWTGDIAAGETVTITYSVQLKSANDIPAGSVLKNHFTSPQSPEGPETNNPIGDLALTKTTDVPAGKSVVAGQVVTYSVTATNNADGPLPGQSIKDDLSDVLSKADLVAGSLATTGSSNLAVIGSDNVLTWSGDMAKGDVVTISYQVTIHDALPNGTTIKNVAVANGGDTPDCTTNPDLPGCNEITTAELALAKTANPASGTAVSPGDVVSYSLTARNTGDSTMSGVVLNDDLSKVNLYGAIQGTPTVTSSVAGKTPAAVSTSGDVLAWGGDVEAGETVTITYSVKLNSTGIPAGAILKNSFTSPQSDNNPKTENPIGDLSVVKTSDVPAGKKVVAGQVITYSITAVNNADGDLLAQSLKDDMTDVLSKTDLVAGSLTTTGSSNLAVIGSDNVLAWSGDVAKGDTVIISYKVTVKDALADGTVFTNAVVANGGTPPTCDVDPIPAECNPMTVGELALAKTASPATGTAVKPGDVVSYVLTATNTGDSAIHSAVLNDDLSKVNLYGAIKDGPSVTSSIAGRTPAAATVSGDTLSWTGDIAAHEVISVTYSVQLNSEDIPTGAVLRNSFTSPQSDNNPKTENPIGDLAVAKSSDVPAGKKVVAGQVVTYTLTARNTADGALTGQSIKDDLTDVLSKADLVQDSLTTTGSAAAASIGADKVLTWSGDLAKGDVVTITYQVKVHNALPDGTALVNAIVANDGPTPDCTSDPTLPDCTVIRTAELSLGKTANPASGVAVQPGQIVAYTLTAKNTGDTAIKDAVLNDDLAKVNEYGAIVTGPVVTSSVAGRTPAAASVTGNLLSWTGDVAPDETITVAYSVQLNADGIPTGSVLKNSFTSPQTDDNPTTENPIGGLAVTKSSDVPSGEKVVAGQVITYTVTGTNTADGPLTDQSMKDDLTDVLSKADFVDGSLTTTGSANAAVLNGKLLTWNGDMAKGDVVTISYKVTVHDALADGTTLINAVVANNGTTPACETDPTLPGCSVVTTGELALAKSADPASGTTAFAGTVVNYALSALNTGNSAIKNAVLNDDLSKVNEYGSVSGLPVVTSSVAGRTPAAATIDGDTLSWTGDIAAGETITIGYAVQLDGSVPDGAVLSNSFTSPQSDDNPVTNNPIQNPDPAVPYLVVAKSTNVPAGDKVAPGQVITYTITGTNPMEGPLTDQLIRDDLSDVLAKADLVEGSLTTSGSTTPAVINGSALTWNGDMAQGDVVTITYQVKVKNALPKGTVIRNVALANDDPNPCPIPMDTVLGELSAGQTLAPADLSDRDPRCTTTEVGSFDLTKSVDVAAGTNVGPDTVITYTLTGTNSSSAAITGAQLDDDMTGVLDNATLVDGSLKTVSSSGAAVTGAVYADEHITWAGDVAPGETITITYQVKVNEAYTDGASVKNVLLSPQSPDKPETRTTLGELELFKSTDVKNGAKVAPGQVITYTLQAKNTGEETLTGQILTDDLSNVLNNATLGSEIKTSWDGEGSVSGVVLNGNEIRWNGDIPGGVTVTITYQVTVNDDAKNGAVLGNQLIANDQPNGPSTETVVEIPSVVPGAITTNTGFDGMALAGMAGLLVALGALALIVGKRRKGNRA